ncbi:MAG: hypothetical protein SVM80_09075 [Halobacteriota archaeon]|nr:hypothetical protein [Halobacteriota archaeon]
MVVTFYEKDGSTVICTVPEHFLVTSTGMISKTFTFYLLNDTDYNNVMGMCENAEQYMAERTPLKGGILFADKSPSQENTIKILDPSGIHTGFGILNGYDLEIPPGMGDNLKTVSMHLVWIGASLGTEIRDGVYKITRS